MKPSASVREFARKNPYAVLVGIAVLLVVSMAAVETSGVLPLEGQATPMYGPMPMPRRVIRNASSSKKPTLKNMRKAQRAAKYSSSSRVSR